MTDKRMVMEINFDPPMIFDGDYIDLGASLPPVHTNRFRTLLNNFWNRVFNEQS